MSHNDELIIRSTWSTLCGIWKKKIYLWKRFGIRKAPEKWCQVCKFGSYSSKIELKKLINGTIRVYDLYFRFRFCFFFRFSHRFIFIEGLIWCLKRSFFFIPLQSFAFIKIELTVNQMHIFKLSKHQKAIVQAFW